MEKSKQKSKNMPEMKFRAGSIAATIWNNQIEKDGEKKEYKTISFERSYQDKEGKWSTTNSLRINDLPKARLVLDKAYEYLVLKNHDDSIMEEIVF